MATLGYLDVFRSLDALGYLGTVTFLVAL
jgi:hypothetical protein